MAALPPQPDFALLAQKMQDISASFGDTSEHFQRCQNLPAVTGTARLEQLIQTMMETTQAQFRAIQTDVAGLRTQLTQVDERVQRLDAKSDAMSTKLITMDRNSIARIENSKPMSSEAVISPLLSLETGGEIPDFPGTLQALGALNTRQMGGILRHLGQSTDGNPEDKKRRLKIALGIRTQMV